MANYEYVGCFFDYEELSLKVRSLRRNPLECEKLCPHVTFEYAPNAVDTSLFGEKIFVTINGYGNDGINEGVRVTLSSENKRINDMITNIVCPHVTLAVSKAGKAVNTRYLAFDDVMPIHIVGRYGGYIDD